MEFSDIFDGRKALFSPDAQYVSVICGDAVDVRFSDSLLKAFRFECRDIVKIHDWSSDSVLLFVAAGLSSIKIFSVNSGACIASLKHSCSGITEVFWAPDSRRLLFQESLLLRVTVWNLLETDELLGINYIHNVQPWAKSSTAFSGNGKHLAVVTTDIVNFPCTNPEKSKNANGSEKFSDYITIFSAVTWRKEKSIPCQGVTRVGGIQWSPDSNILAVWSAYSSDPLLILSVYAGNMVAQWAPCSIKFWPGLERVVFSPSAQFFAALGLDSKIHILNYIGWQEEIELPHQLPINDESCHIFQQIRAFSQSGLQLKEVSERPVSISLLCMPLNSNNISKVCWSSGGRYLATCINRAPAVVWIWNVQSSFSLVTVFVMEHPISCFSWDPVQNMLAIVTSDDCLSLWCANKRTLMCLPVCVPAPSIPFQATHLTWSSDGKMLVMSSQQNSVLLELCE